MIAVAARDFDQSTVTIASGAAVSSTPAAAATLGGLPGFSTGFVVPTGSWTAADLTFQVAYLVAGVLTWVNAYDPAGTLLRITPVAVGKAYALPTYLGGAGRWRLRSTNTASEADVTQGGARTLYLFLKS